MSDEGPRILELILDEVKTIRVKAYESDNRLNSIDVTLAKQSISLDNHIKRTEMLEHRMEPVEKHVLMLNGFFKILGLLGTIVAIAVGIFQLFKLIP